MDKLPLLLSSEFYQISLIYPKGKHNYVLCIICCRRCIRI